MNALLYCKGKASSEKDVNARNTFSMSKLYQGSTPAGITEIYYKDDYRVDEYALELIKKQQNKISKHEIGV